MIVDLHAHYPMHIRPGSPGRRRRLSAAGKRPWRLLRSRERLLLPDARFRSLLLAIASVLKNYQSFFSGPRVRMEYMKVGGVRVALSVLYSFFDEVDVRDGLRPKAAYIDELIEQLRNVEAHVRANHPDDAAVATNPAKIAQAHTAEKVAIVHCVEGGFHLGGTTEDVTSSVKQLAELGVAYITLAHLLWREIATDAPALPFMRDDEYRTWLPQPADGLSELGEAAIRAMHEHKVLIDIAHMSEQSVNDTFDLLDELDPNKSVPVVATHAGYRFAQNGQEYMLSRRTIERIAERDGVIGLIFAQHQLYDGLADQPLSRYGRPLRKLRRFDDSVRVLRKHIDRIYDITGSHRHTAIGSDMDGFIKPTLPGLRDMRDMARLERALQARYKEDAALICSQNALRLLTDYWRGGPGASESNAGLRSS